ncbi:MAG: hypothetical protein CMN30_28735 [Sandaracinus sp.]|nr:hypothetical protein [Sandaracinus sp.]
MLRLAPFAFAATLLAALAPSSAARADAPAHTPDDARRADGEPTSWQAGLSDEEIAAHPRVLTLRRRTRWFAGLTLASLGAGAVLFGVSARFQGEHPTFERITGSAGGLMGASLALGITTLAVAAEKRRVEAELRGYRLDPARVRRRNRLLGVGWGLFGFGGLLFTLGFALPSGGEDDSDDASRLGQIVLLGSMGGSLAMVGLFTAIWGHALQTRSSVWVTAGPGTIGLAGTF